MWKAHQNRRKKEYMETNDVGSRFAIITWLGWKVGSWIRIRIGYSSLTQVIFTKSLKSKEGNLMQSWISYHFFCFTLFVFRYFDDRFWNYSAAKHISAFSISFRTGTCSFFLLFCAISSSNGLFTVV